jgi:hypothetical protein
VSSLVEEQEAAMSKPLKVFQLAFAVIDAILELADLPAQASEVERGKDSPTSRPRQLLPASIIGALRNARRSRDLIGDRQMVALRPEDAPILSRWLRDLAAQPGVADGDRPRFRDAADVIEQAKP